MRSIGFYKLIIYIVCFGPWLLACHTSIRQDNYSQLISMDSDRARFDSQRMINAAAVLRVKPLAPSEGSQWHYRTVEVLAIYKNELWKDIPSRVVVAKWHENPELPDVECTIYLEEHKPRWPMSKPVAKLLNGNLDNAGVSHLQP